MDPIGLTLLCVFIAAGGIRGWWQRLGARLTGNTEALNAQRAQERQHEHERAMQREHHRHGETMAGRAHPSFWTSVGAGVGQRFARGPIPYEQRHPLRRWWWDLVDDHMDRLTRERRERLEREARGEQWWQRLAAAARRRAQEYWEKVQAEREERRRTVDAEWWDNPPPPGPSAPHAPNQGTVDADVVPDPPAPRPAADQRPELEPPFPDWPTAPPQSGKSSTSGERCPGCNNPSVGWCYLCLSAWGKSDNPDMADWAVRRRLGWEAAVQDLSRDADFASAPVRATAERDADATPPVPPRELQNHDGDEDGNPPTTVLAIAERIPEPLGASPAEPNSNNEGTGMTYITGDPAAAELSAEIERQISAGFTPERQDVARRDRAVIREQLARERAGSSGGGGVAIPQQSRSAMALNGETVDPESLGGFASGMQQVAHAMQSSIEQSIANLTSLGVSGQPIDDLFAMADAAATLAGRSQSTASHAASHADIQAVAHSDPTVGGEHYLGIGHARR